MNLLERFLRWYLGRPRVDKAKLDDLENWWAGERDREEREARAERARAERERAHQAAVARCAAEGHEEPSEVDIIRWDHPEPVQTLRTCPRCGEDVPAEVDA